MNEDITSIFLCQRPCDYFCIVKISMMAISLYWGLWLTNYCIIAYRLPEQALTWFILSLAPAFINSCLYIYIIKCAALLKV